MKIAVQQTQTLQKNSFVKNITYFIIIDLNFFQNPHSPFLKGKNVPTFLFTYSGKFSKTQRYFLFHLKFKQNGK